MTQTCLTLSRQPSWKVMMSRANGFSGASAPAQIGSTTVCRRTMNQRRSKRPMLPGYRYLETTIADSCPSTCLPIAIPRRPPLRSTSGPIGELRHLLQAARQWRVRQLQRAAEPIEMDQQLRQLQSRHAENRALLDRLYRDQAQALLARHRDTSIMVLSAPEARRSATGNHLQGDPGLDLERHIRQVSAEAGFAVGQPHWDSASKRLFIDLYHLEAEAWWDSGEASGVVRVPPKGDVLCRKRRYRALYPFQRAAINAAYGNRGTQQDSRAVDTLTESAGRPIVDAADERITSFAEPENGPLNHIEEQVELETTTQLQATSAQGAVAESPSVTAPSEANEQTTDSQRPSVPHTRPATVPNARKGFKLTLWVSPTDESGLTDVHGLLQLDGADPVPFCQLRGVSNPIARALQEAYVAVERVRAKPPRMAPPSIPSVPSVRSTTGGPAPRTQAPPPARPAAEPVLPQPATSAKRAPAQQTLF
jgi:hypothetical protein